MTYVYLPAFMLPLLIITCIYFGYQMAWSGYAVQSLIRWLRSRRQR